MRKEIIVKSFIQVLNYLLFIQTLIDEGFISLHQSFMTKIENYASEYWIVLDIVIKHSIKIPAC